MADRLACPITRFVDLACCLGGVAGYADRAARFGSSVTQQYIVGQFSVLLEDLQPPSGEWLAAVWRLRREVESCSLSMLPRLADEAIGLTDLICWSALEQGDLDGFCACARSAAALGEFIDNARLLQD
jgi:hypothetical protein